MTFLALLLVFIAFFTASDVLGGTLTGTGTLHSYTLDKAPHAGSRTRQYKVYVPRSYDRSQPVPMVMALHGCAMTHDEAIKNWNWDLVADEHGVIVVFPFITEYDGMRSQNCWGYWFDHHIHEGAGEVADLHLLARQVEANYRIDPERRYIIGLSSGGAMTVVSAVAYNEYWAAAAPAAGLPYGDWASSVTAESFKSVDEHIRAIEAELDDERTIPLLVVHSQNDEVVRIRAAELIRDAHMRGFAGEYGTAIEEDCTAEGIACTHTKYKDRTGNTVVETVLFDGAVAGTQCGSLGCGHYYGGEDDDPNAWVFARGPSTTRIAWEFFSRHTLSGNEAPQVSASTNVQDATIRVTGSATDPGGTVASVEVSIERRVDNTYQVYQRVPVPGDYARFTVSSEALPAGVYKVYVVATDDHGAQTQSTPEIAFVNYEAHAPAVSELAATVERNNVKITGTVEDADNDLDFVSVTVGDEAVRATVVGDSLSAVLHDVPAGDHTAVITAYDLLEQTGSASADFAVEYVSPPSATGTIQAHCEASRIPWSEYATYYLRYGHEPFTVYQSSDGTWREEPERPPDDQDACLNDTVSGHVDAGRAYGKWTWRWWPTKTYHAKGSDDSLGDQSGMTVALMETRPGYWSRVDTCP